MLVYNLKLAHYAFDIFWHYHYNWGSSHEAVWGAMARRCYGLFILHPMQGIIRWFTPTTSGFIFGVMQSSQIIKTFQLQQIGRTYDGHIYGSRSHTRTLCARYFWRIR